MRLLTLRTHGTAVTGRVRQDGDTLTEIDGFADVGALLRSADWEATAAAAGASHPLEGADLDAVVPSPGKIICVGHNYRNHIKEMGREVPEFPTLLRQVPGIPDRPERRPRPAAGIRHGRLGVRTRRRDRQEGPPDQRSRRRRTTSPATPCSTT